MRKRVIGLLAVLLMASTAGRSDADGALGRVVEAFQASSAASLRPLLSEDRKTFVSLPGLYPEQGHFGASQVYYIFKEVFAKVSTREVSIDFSRSGDGTVRARLSWLYVQRDDGRERSTSLSVVLEATPQGHALTEVRASER